MKTQAEQLFDDMQLAAQDEDLSSAAETLRIVNGKVTCPRCMGDKIRVLTLQMWEQNAHQEDGIIYSPPDKCHHDTLGVYGTLWRAVRCIECGATWIPHGPMRQEAPHPGPYLLNRRQQPLCPRGHVLFRMDIKTQTVRVYKNDFNEFEMSSINDLWEETVGWMCEICGVMYDVSELDFLGG